MKQSLGWVGGALALVLGIVPGCGGGAAAPPSSIPSPPKTYRLKPAGYALDLSAYAAGTVLPCTVWLARDGHIQISTARVDDDARDGLLCFDTSDASSSLVWPEWVYVRVEGPGHGPFRDADGGEVDPDGQGQRVNTRNQVVVLPRNAEAGVKVEIRGQDVAQEVNDNVIKETARALERDAAFLATLGSSCRGDARDVMRAYLDAHENGWPQLANDLKARHELSDHRLLFSGVLPTATLGDGLQRVYVDAAGGTSETNIVADEGERIQGWAFNVAADASQHVAIVRGTRVVQASGIGPLLLYAFTTTGSPFTVPAALGSGTSVGADPPTATSGAPASSASAPAPPSDDALRAASAAAVVALFKDPADAGGARAVAQAPADAVTPPCNVGEQITNEIASRIASRSSSSERFTAVATYATVQSGYTYGVEVRDTRAVQALGGSDAGAGASDLPSADPSIGRNDFHVRQTHRFVSVAIEEAYNWNREPVLSSYAYVPVAQTGTDQIFQLQQVSHGADAFTFSAALTVYPLAIPCGRYDRRGVRRFFERLALSFGPTFFRGGTAEAFKQWNLRAGFEVLPDVLLTAGPSFRTVDFPSGDSSVGTLVSVPKPVAAPGFPTSPATELVWSFGLSVDLAVLTDSISAVSTAVSTAKGGSK